MKKRTALFATMMVTLGAAFMHCGTVEAATDDICGLYTITLEEYDRETMRFGDVEERFNVVISSVDDYSIEVSLSHPLNDYTMGCILEKSESDEYDYYSDNYWIKSIDGDWFLCIDNGPMQLDPIINEDMVFSYTSDTPDIKHPVGVYTSDDGFNFMIDTFITKAYIDSPITYQILYTDEYGELITEVLTEDCQYSNGYKYTTFSCDLGVLFTYDQNDFSDFAGFVFSGSDECTIFTKMDCDTYDDIYSYDGMRLIAPCEVNGEYETIYIDFTLNIDEYDFTSLGYTVCFENSDEVIEGTAILFGFGSQIISNDFIIDATACTIVLPMLSSDAYECNMAWC